VIIVGKDDKSCIVPFLNEAEGKSTSESKADGLSAHQLFVVLAALLPAAF
jgi:hypothetical protein